MRATSMEAEAEEFCERMRESLSLLASFPCVHVFCFFIKQLNIMEYIYI